LFVTMPCFAGGLVHLSDGEDRLGERNIPGIAFRWIKPRVRAEGLEMALSFLTLTPAGRTLSLSM